jgi:hypothetical protein
MSGQHGTKRLSDEQTLSVGKGAPMTFRQHLEAIGACAEAREWAGNRTARQAWEDCTNPAWLMWWIERDSPAATATARQAYGEAIARSQMACDEAQAKAWKAFGEAIAPSRMALEAALATARKAHAALAPAWKAFDEATAPARMALAGAMAPAWKALVEAQATVGCEAIRAAVAIPWEEK